MKRYPIVQVEWVDPSHYRDSRDIEWLQKEGSFVKMSTAGYLLKKDKHMLVIAHELDDEGRARDTSVIPRPIVTSVVVVTK